jgi:hypothetical protein
MNPATIIDKIRATGVDLGVTPDYRLSVTGKSIKPEQIEYLKDHRDEIVDHLCREQFQFEVLRITLPDDRGFIVKRLQYASNQTRLAVVRRWHSEFAKAWQAEPDGIAKDNAGRYRANSWLLELDVIRACAPAFTPITENPSPSVTYTQKN